MKLRHIASRATLPARGALVLLLSVALLATSAPVPDLPEIIAGSMSKNRDFLRRSLDADMVKSIVQSLNRELPSPGERQVLEEALETAVRKLNAGRPGKVTTTEALAEALKGNKAHGDLFETLAARVDRGSYTGLGNPGVDYHRWDYATQRNFFSQAKATQTATQSARDAMVDALEFLGNDPVRRAPDLIKGHSVFEAVIPKNQFAELVSKGLVTADGKPTEELLQRALRSAATRAQKEGEVATRIKAALASGKAEDILSRVVVRPGPVTYSELRELTKTAQKALARLSTVLRNPAVNALGKTAGVAGVLASVPIMFARLDELEARKVNGTVSDQEIDKETFAIYGTAGLSAGVGLALLVFTPAGWVGLGVVGAGMITCYLVDDGCFKLLYEKVVETAEAKRAFEELRRLRGERAAHLSGFTIPPDVIVNVDERGSYELAWKKAGSPAPQLPPRVLERAFETQDTRMWVDSQPTSDDILRFKLVQSPPGGAEPAQGQTHSGPQ